MPAGMNTSIQRKKKIEKFSQNEEEENRKYKTIKESFQRTIQIIEVPQRELRKKRGRFFLIIKENFSKLKDMSYQN